jgi:hypothetical protein
MPTVVLVLLASLVALSTIAVGPFAVLPIFGVLFFAVIVVRPEYGIALFLSTFLMNYPASLQGAGALTINNVLGGIFIILLTYKQYREEDWWFLYNRELQLFAAIIVVYIISARFNGPDPDKVALMGLQEFGAANLRTFINRVMFVVFFVNFIRTPEHVRMIFLLAIAFMVVTALTGIQSVLHGGGLYGYRASSEAAVIASAYNPNRLAMFAIVAIAGLWYVMRSLPIPGIIYLIIPTIVVLALAVVMAASRSGLMGLGVCGVAIVIDEKFNIRTLLSFGLAVLALLLLATQFVPEKSLERITNLPFLGGQSDLGTSSFERRQYTWDIAIQMFEASPLIGVGMGNWELARYLVDPLRSTGAPHSSYLLAAVEGGILCLLLFLYLLWRTWRNLRWVERYLVDPTFPLHHIAWIVKGAKVSFLVLIFFSIFADLWQLVILFWLVGLSIVIRRMVEQTLDEEEAAARAY